MGARRAEAVSSVVVAIVAALLTVGVGPAQAVTGIDSPYVMTDSAEVGGPSLNPRIVTNRLTFFDPDVFPTQTLNADEGVASVALPFNFIYYGIFYSAGAPIGVSSNGFIDFSVDGGSDASANTALSGAAAPTNGDMIAAHWDNLVTTNPPDASTNRVNTGTLGTAPNRVFVISFENIDQAGAPVDSLDFQV